MTDATKAAILLGALTLTAIVGGLYGAHQSAAKAAALHRAAIAEGEARASQQAETQAKAERAAAQQVAATQLQRVADLERQLAQHPAPPPAQPVPPDAPAALVVAGLSGLGLHPRLLGEAVKDSLTTEPLALGLTLPDARTTLQWGREAQRVPPLAARLGALEALAQAQEGATSALLQRADAADRATSAADARADAEHRRAEALQQALHLTPVDRPWTAGLLVGLDTTGTRRAGAYLSRSWGPIHAQVVVLGNTAAVGGGIRF
jgi:hypothetical protein